MERLFGEIPTDGKQLSLLELVLWKTRINNGATFQSMQEMRENAVFLMQTLIRLDVPK